MLAGLIGIALLHTQDDVVKDIPLALVVLVERWGFYPDSCGYLLHGDGLVAADGEEPQRLGKYPCFGVGVSHGAFLPAALMPLLYS